MVDASADGLKVSPMGLYVMLIVVMVGITVTRERRLAAPSSAIRLWLRSSSRRTLFVRRASERAKTPVLVILFLKREEEEEDCEFEC